MLTIIEHKNETIEIKNSNKTVICFPPEPDLNEAIRLLKAFNTIEENKTKKIYELWEYKNHFIFPGIQEFLFWNFFSQIVKHKKAFQFLRGKKHRFKKLPYYTISGLQRIYHLLYHKHSCLERWTYNTLSNFFRKTHRFHPNLLKDDGPNGFRYDKLSNTLLSIAPHSKVEKLKAENVKTLLKKRDSFITGYYPFIYTPPPQFNYESLTFLHPYLTQQEFLQLIKAIHRFSQNKIAEARCLDQYTKKSPFNQLITYDQIEEILPLIIACKINKIPTTSYQHGVLTKFHTGWLAPSIPTSYCNAIPDKIIVWGEYWKNKLRKYSQKYNKQNIIVGPHLNKEVVFSPHRSNNNNSPVTILFPYEFLADNIEISKYIRKCLLLGWKVIVKIRPPGSGDINYDTLAYDEDIREKIAFKHALNNNDLKEIQVIACTQTTFAYEMTKYHKSIWYLKTKFNMLEDLVEDKIAHYIDLDILSSLKNKKNLAQYLRPLYDESLYRTLFSTAQQTEFFRNFFSKNLRNKSTTPL